MKSTATCAMPKPAAAVATGRLLQRQCSCGNYVSGGGTCSACARGKLHRHAQVAGPIPTISPSVDETLSTPGHALDPDTRRFMEGRFKQDFSAVRVHADGAAGASARAVDAAAYTVGRHVVFGNGRYTPHTPMGKRLLAHELTHVVQQSAFGAANATGDLSIDPPDSASEREADRASNSVLADSAPAADVQQRSATPRLARADPKIADAVPLTANLGTTPRTGLQFSPTQVTDTRVGPVSAQPGLLLGGASRLNVIVGENLSLRTLAIELLPLWTTATPFTPPAAAAPLPLDIIDADELAQGLMAYNENYLPVPSMTRWRAGLRFPLPVDIDTTTGVATLHPLQIRALASAFQAAWTPLLDQRTGATVAPSAATLQADVATFLTTTTDALGRGIALNARALTNALAERPFVHEVLHQLGAGAFDVALAFMDNLVNREVDLLTSQRDGFEILMDISSALATPPATLSPMQKASLDRANAMTGVLVGSAAAPPDAMRSRAEKTVTVDTVMLEGSNRDPAADVRQANSMFAQCNVRLNHSANRTASLAQTTAWIGTDQTVDVPNCGGNAEQRRLSEGANKDFALAGRIRVFYVKALKGGDRAASCRLAGVPKLLQHVTWMGNDATGRTLGHELGHQFLDSDAGVDDHPKKDTKRLLATSNISPLGETLTDKECDRIHKNA
jgi:hypothetical protein